MSRRRMGSFEASLVLGLCMVMGCTPQGTAGEAKALDPNLQQYVLGKLPKTVEHETYLDFGGKVQLVGYDISPAEVAAPGSQISLTLYWQRTGALDRPHRIANEQRAHRFAVPVGEHDEHRPADEVLQTHRVAVLVHQVQGRRDPIQARRNRRWASLRGRPASSKVTTSTRGSATRRIVAVARSPPRRW